MSLPERQYLTLANGLEVTLIHDPDATRAAALFQLAAGSHQEPAAWPGLAHLLEHVLFAGSEGFQNEQRLMAWAPAQGARLNATTQANQTAWFFEIAAPMLADGLSRLADMLARPLLSSEAIRQETAVIDAEYRMLTTHRSTLCEAALSQAFVAPHPFRDFHVGNLATFGKDIPTLRQALQAYYQRYFHPRHLRLWLQGPQSMAELAAMAKTLEQAFSTGSVSATPAVILTTGAESTSAAGSFVGLATLLHDTQSLPLLTLRSERTFALQSTGAEQLLLSFPVTAIAPPLLSVLRELLTDKAAMGLLATLREQRLCDDIQLLEPYRSPQQSLLSVVFQLSEARHEQCLAIEAAFYRWLQLLIALTPSQLAHYARLSQRQFARISPLDQLRALAFGFPPATAAMSSRSEEHAVRQDDWRNLLLHLKQENMTRLWVTPGADLPVASVQGFALNTGIIVWPALPSGRNRSSALRSDRRDWPTLPPVPLPEMAIHQPGTALPLPRLPTETAVLQAIPANSEASLLLSPFPGQRLTDRQAAMIETALQPIIAECQHHEGELHFSPQQGCWLLQFSGYRELLLYSLDKVQTVLGAPTTAIMEIQSERRYRQTQQTLFSDIAVRCLLNRLPRLLQPATDELSRTVWQAALYGGDQALHQTLARLLSRFPAKLSSAPLNRVPLLPDLAEYIFATQSHDAAVIVFCPLAEVYPLNLATWQVLAALFEPRFFQRLRVEKNIGYVVSCRFHQTAGQAGLLFALQSPTLQANELYRHISVFIHTMATVITTLKMDELQEKILSLQNTLPVQPASTPSQCVEHWRYQQLSLPPLTPKIYTQITVEHLRQAQQYLSENPHRWWHLSNAVKGQNRDDQTTAEYSDQLSPE